MSRFNFHAAQIKRDLAARYLDTLVKAEVQTAGHLIDRDLKERIPVLADLAFLLAGAVDRQSDEEQHARAIEEHEEERDERRSQLRRQRRTDREEADADREGRAWDLRLSEREQEAAFREQLRGHVMAAIPLVMSAIDVHVAKQQRIERDHAAAYAAAHECPPATSPASSSSSSSEAAAE